MTEVGLIHFAHVAREVAETVLPSYRSRYSKLLSLKTVAAGHSVPHALRRLASPRGGSAP
jgi:hypothetical protein